MHDLECTENTVHLHYKLSKDVGQYVCKPQVCSLTTHTKSHFHVSITFRCGDVLYANVNKFSELLYFTT